MTHLKTTASKKVKIGVRFPMADERVGELYFTPPKNRSFPPLLQREEGKKKKTGSHLIYSPFLVYFTNEDKLNEFFM